LAVVFVSVIGLAVIGTTDDIRPIAALPRLLLQAIAVVAVLASLPDDLRVLAVLPWWLERALLFVAMLWFVNLVNFMDGIDWMTVAEVVSFNIISPQCFTR
jgi:UDP-N-acetylmuramyl pentapeptide phosphotransferase/UDP-N-acetylglucosamine-1-phosphate transferase